MNYAESYNYLLSLNNVARKEYLKDSSECLYYLKRLQFLLDVLGNPEKKIPHYIHVTGTSGKGSVCLMLASILKADKRRVGLLTSPSPDGFLGRTEVNGKVISKKEFAVIVTKIKKALSVCKKNSPYDTPSPFEILTALSFMHFANAKVTWAIIEVGLGGRYDSTNVIPHKDIAIVTNIGFDHVELLGNTLKKIAYEKAGIIKPGCVTITGAGQKGPLAVIKKESRLTKTKLIQVRGGKLTTSDARGVTFVYKNESYHCNVLGEHQVTNATLAIEAALTLGIPVTTIQSGLATTKFPLRMEIIKKNPLIIVDGAHNPDKMKSTVNTTRALRTIYKANNTHLVLGFSADKNVSAMLKQLKGLRPASVACTRFTKNILRLAADPLELKDKLKQLLPNTNIQAFLNPSEALGWSRRQQRKTDLLLVTGSIFLGGELRSILLPEAPQV